MTSKRKNTVVRSLAKFSFLALLLASVYLYRLTLPVSRQGAPQQFEVKKGESASAIATNLYSAHLIRSPLYFRILVETQDLTLQAGIFQLSSATSPKHLARILTTGKTLDRKLTIPEGYRTEQIAQTAGFPIKAFQTAAEGLEGQLFPDTYFVKEEITPEELVDIMHDNFAAKVGPIDRQSLILASLVERETAGGSEKPVVAGILKKRLAAGWPLELDASVQYFLGKPGDWWPAPTLLDRRLSSPYNTYLHTGLPPGPISNPGLAAIDAVRNSQDSPYWFYLHDKTGQIHYAQTSQEHNSNIAKYIR